MKKAAVSILMMIMVTGVFGQKKFPDSTTKILLRNYKQSLKGKERSDTTYFRLMLRCAQNGDGWAMNNIGIMYKRGNGVIPNGAEAAYWFQRSAESGYTNAWLQLGRHYKGMRSPDQNFTKAYQCFDKGDIANDLECAYMKGYMHYKGLGCNQDYTKAFWLFKKAADKGLSHAMYFLALCYRNGYGVEKNKKSADYWLTLAIQKGSRQALLEIKNEFSENENTGATQITTNMNEVLVENEPFNNFRKVENSTSPEFLTGKFKGFAITYDWSGKDIVNTAPLELTITERQGMLFGVWKENDSLEIQLKGQLTPLNVSFLNNSYKRTDYYSKVKPVEYSIDEAELSWKQKGDSFYLIGHVKMFSPTRNEPHKPLKIILVRQPQKENNSYSLISKAKELQFTESSIYAYPNPFKNILNIVLKIPGTTNVSLKIFDINGKQVYHKEAGVLVKGIYTFRYSPSSIATGTYTLVLNCGNNTNSIRIIKE